MQGAKNSQQQLRFKPMIGPHEFTKAGTLHAVANLIATNNQVSSNHFVSNNTLLTILAPRTCR